MGFLENLTNDAFANKMAEHYQAQIFPAAPSMPHATDGLSPDKKADYFHTHIGAAPFKSIRGETSPGGDKFAQPFIQRGIQNGAGIPSKNINFVTAPEIDTSRVSRFMQSPKGLLFIAKQAGLQLSNPKGEYKSLGPIHLGRIYNPLATVAQIPAGALGIHIDRHGLGPLNFEASNYEKRVSKKNQIEDGVANRLVSIANQLNVGYFKELIVAPTEIHLGTPKEKTFIQKVADRIKNTNWYINRRIKINAMSGLGGPNSLFGIGRTRHFTSKPPRIDGEIIIKYEPPEGTNLPVGHLGPGSYTEKLPEGMYVNLHNFFDPVSPNDPNGPKADSSENPLAKYKTLNYGGIVKAGKNVSSVEPLKSFREDGGEGTRYDSGLGAYARIGLIDYGNALDNFKDDKYGETGGGTSDYCTLKLASDTKEILLRSYGLGSITDNTSFNWSEVKYAGRTMAQYKFGDVSRDVSHDLIIVAFTKGELKQNMAKLNKLYQIASPSVDSSSGLASAPLVQLTLGDLYKDQNVVIDKITFTVEEDTPWDIGFGEGLTAGAELPMIVKLNLGYKLITNAGGKFFTNSSTYWNPVA